MFACFIWAHKFHIDSRPLLGVLKTDFPNTQKLNYVLLEYLNFFFESSNFFFARHATDGLKKPAKYSTR